MSASKLNFDINGKHFKTLAYTRERLVAIYDVLQQKVAAAPTRENIELAQMLDELLTCPVCKNYTPSLNGEYRLSTCGCSPCQKECFAKLARNGGMCPRCNKGIF